MAAKQLTDKQRADQYRARALALLKQCIKLRKRWMYWAEKAGY